jgi:hypothetical protein
LTINCCLATSINTSVTQLLATYSDSSFSVTSNNNLAIQNGGGSTWISNRQVVLTTSAIVTTSTQKTYYMLCSATAGNMEFRPGNSSFEAIRIK